MKYLFSFILILTCNLMPIAAFAQEASQIQNEILSHLEANANEKTTLLARTMRQRLQAGTLQLIVNPKEYTNPNHCGFVIMNELMPAKLHINPNCPPALLVKATVHEYEHIRIYEEEVFEDMYQAYLNNRPADRISAWALDVYRARNLDLFIGETGPNRLSSEDVERLKVVETLFRIYTETKAFLTERSHLGRLITFAQSDTDILNTLQSHYLQNDDISPADLIQAFTAAKEARNYEAYIEATADLR